MVLVKVCSAYDVFGELTQSRHQLMVYLRLEELNGLSTWVAFGSINKVVKIENPPEVALGWIFLVGSISNLKDSSVRFTKSKSLLKAGIEPATSGS